MERTSQSRGIDILWRMVMVGADNLTVEVEVDVLLVHGGRAPCAWRLDDEVEVFELVMSRSSSSSSSMPSMEAEAACCYESNKQRN